MTSKTVKATQYDSCFGLGTLRAYTTEERVAFERNPVRQPCALSDCPDRATELVWVECVGWGPQSHPLCGYHARWERGQVRVSVVRKAAKRVFKRDILARHARRG
ncbi:MAG TPA: hypothetical protein VIS06_12040 [Mycobacteriales bacterium]|jgi:hypothetical protein